MRRSGAISGSIDSPLAALSSEVAEREAALTQQLAAAEARAQSAAAERDAIRVSLRLCGAALPAHQGLGLVV